MAKQHVNCECGHSWYTSKDPAKDRIQCGACGKYIASVNNFSIEEMQEGKPIANAIPEKKKADKAGFTRDIVVSKPIKLSTKALHLADNLISRGIYQNLDEVAVRAIENMAVGVGGSGNSSETNEDLLKKRIEVQKKQEDLKMADLDRQLKMMQAASAAGSNGQGIGADDIDNIMNKSLKQQLLHAQIKTMLDSLKGNDGNGKNDTLNTILMMKMFDNKPQGGGQDDLIKLVMMQKLLGNDNGGSNKEIEGLKEAIKKMQEDAKDKQMLELIQAISKNKQSDTLSVKDWLELYKDRDAGNKEKDKELAEEREKRAKAELDFKIKELETQIMGSGNSLSGDKIVELKETIKTLKETAKELSGESTKTTSNTEIIADVVKTGLNAFGPALHEFASHKSATGNPGSGKYVHPGDITPEQFERLNPEDQQKVLNWQKKAAGEEQAPAPVPRPSPANKYASLIQVS